MDLVFMYYVLYFVILPQVISIVSASPSRVSSGVHFDDIGPTSANLSWATASNSSFCNLGYSVSGTSVEMERIEPNTGSGRFLYRCWLGDLQEATNYSLSIQCRNTSKIVVWQTMEHFKTLSKPTPFNRTTIQSTTEVSTDTTITSEAATTQVINTAPPPSAGTALDIVLGALSALLGVILMGIVTFYLWRKYQRRRRIRQFFRHHQLAQPFPSEVNM